MEYNLDFLNANSLRSYPIKDGLTKLDTSGTFTIPNDFVVDLVLTATSDVTKRFYISKISNLPDNIVIEISDDSSVICGTFNVNVAGNTKLYTDYYLTPGTSYSGANGRICIGSLETITNLDSGVFYFTLTTTELETRTIIPALNTVTRIVFTNADATSFSMTGDIILSARKNVKFTNNTTYASLDAGDGLGLNSSCSSVAPCIQTINNISPDSHGNFTIITSDCASITALSGTNAAGILLSDTCCKPCMGCDEISTLTSRLMQLETDLLALRDHYNSLLSNLQQLSTLVGFTCEC